MAENTRELTGLRRVGDADVNPLVAMFSTLAEWDKSFVEGALDRETVARWPRDRTASRWVVGTESEVYGYLAVIPHTGSSSHVGDLRLVVAASHRGKGVGRELAHHGLLQAVALELLKVTVSVSAEKEGDIAMFTSIGFRPEALLENHIRDRDGLLHDLVMLSHDVTQVSEDLAVLGLDAAVGVGSDEG